MAWYFFRQESSDSRWKIALASERERIIKEEKPELVTVLDVDNDFTRDLTLDEMQAVRYSGPFYVDFDADDEDFSVIIAQFQKFLNKLIEKDLSLDTVRLYATGGRGFHVEVPLAAFLGKVPPAGVVGLPHIFKEIAYQLYVDNLDMRVYSAKKGRMWRCPNVERSNGKHKVAITPDEAMKMTPDLYDQLCAMPRPAPALEPATFNPNLGLIYSQAKDKVEAGLRRLKSRKRNSEEAKRFKGEWPDTVKAILDGKALKEGVGWNRIAMQLSLTADALGKNEEQLLAEAEPLLETYQGDSARYGNYRKRKLHLQEMFRYLAGNITYEFSVGGLIALCKPDQDVSDLSNGEYVPDPEEEVEGQSDDEDEDTVPHGAVDNTPVKINRYGIWSRTEEGWKQSSAMGVGDPFMLVDSEGKSVGYDVVIYIDGKPRGRHILPAQQFASKTQLNNFGLTWSASVTTSDAQTAMLADILRRRVEKKNGVTYVVNREGIDLIRPPGAKKESEMEIIWSAPDGVVSTKGNRYRFSSDMGREGTFQSDLMNAPELTNSEQDEKLVEALIKLNSPVNVSRLLGWFCACFMCQPIRHVSAGKFPPLQVYGQAEAGKSRTISYYNRLHYYLQQPKEVMSAGMTRYPALTAAVVSASMPVVFEELKRHEMPRGMADFLKALIRSSYDGHNVERGGLSRDAGPKEIVIKKHQLAGPVAFVGEAIEDQTAVMHRAITVAMSREHRSGRTVYDEILRTRASEIGKVGRLLATRCLHLDMEKLKVEVEGLLKQVYSHIDPEQEASSRLSASMVVPLLGLRLLKGSLFTVFGNRFDADIDVLENSLLENLDTMLPKNQSEAAKVLDTMAQLTRIDDVQYKLERDKDYRVSDDGLHTEVNLKQSYDKYVKYMRSMGADSLYPSQSAFLSGMASYGGVVAKSCPSSPLFNNPRQVIYLLSNEYLDKEECEPFEP